jgi:N-acetylglucosamine-6-phosphate deacetylase
MAIGMILNLAEIYTPKRRIIRGSIKIENGVIKDLKPYWRSSDHSQETKEMIAAPGFIDTHIHGYAGFDVSSGSINEIKRLSEELIKIGVTSFVPTTVSLKHEDLVKVAEAIGDLLSEDPMDHNRSRVLGLHLEGPYINVEMRGAQNPEAIRKLDMSEIDEYIKASERNIRIITLAPEIDNVLEKIPEIVNRGVIVSIGHTNASYEETKKAIERGARRITHIFNGMRRFHHRDPGPALAGLEDERVFIEFIADLVHLASPVVKMITKVARSRAVVITDSISATGLGDGVYMLGGLKVVVKDSVARLEDGTLAGSTLTMIKALYNLIHIGLDVSEALYHLTEAPARSLEIKSLGCLRPGCVADIILMNKDLGISKVFLEGEEVYTK